MRLCQVLSLELTPSKRSVNEHYYFSELNLRNNEVVISVSGSCPAGGKNSWKRD